MYPLKQPYELIKALVGECSPTVMTTSEQVVGNSMIVPVIDSHDDLSIANIRRVSKSSNSSSFLGGSGSSTRISALKSLKNLVIGNPKKKQLLAEMGILPM